MSHETNENSLIALLRVAILSVVCAHLSVQLPCCGYRVAVMYVTLMQQTISLLSIPFFVQPIVIEMTEDQLLAELASIRQKVNALKAEAAKAKEHSKEKDTEDFTRTVLIGGLTLALVPLLLPYLSSLR